MKGTRQRLDATTGETIIEEYDFDQIPIVAPKNKLFEALKKKGILTDADVA